MDLIILVLLILVVIFFFRSFHSFVYFMAIADIFLRIIDFTCSIFGKYLPEVAKFLDTYIPSNIPSIINTYSTGIFNELLMIGYLIIFIIFECYIIKYFFKKKRR